MASSEPVEPFGELKEFCKRKGLMYAPVHERILDVIGGEEVLFTYSTPYQRDWEEDTQGKIHPPPDLLARVLVVTKKLLFDIEIGSKTAEYGVYPLQGVSAIEVHFLDYYVVVNLDLSPGLSGLGIVDDKRNTKKIRPFVTKLRRILWGQ